MHIYFNDADALADVLAANNDVAAFIVEPVQGEGGMIPGSTWLFEGSSAIM